MVYTQCGGVQEEIPCDFGKSSEGGRLSARVASSNTKKSLDMSDL